MGVVKFTRGTPRARATGVPPVLNCEWIHVLQFNTGGTTVAPSVVKFSRGTPRPPLRFGTCHPKTPTARLFRSGQGGELLRQFALRMGNSPWGRRPMMRSTGRRGAALMLFALLFTAGCHGD